MQKPFIANRNDQMFLYVVGMRCVDRGDKLFRAIACGICENVVSASCLDDVA